MNIGEAIVGVLFQKPSHIRITSKDRQVAVETEFGYMTNTEIVDPVISCDVHKLISSYCPVVEIASPNLRKGRQASISSQPTPLLQIYSRQKPGYR